MVSIQDIISDQVELCYGVPQGSVLGSSLHFILYTQPLTHVILNHPVSHVLYADETQVFKSCNINDLASAIFCVERCVPNIKTSMLSNKLQMNEDKTEVLLVTPKRVVKSEPFPEFLNINGTSVKFCPSLRNLRVILDSTLSLHQHVLNVCRGAFLELRRINSIRNFLKCVRDFLFADDAAITTHTQEDLQRLLDRFQMLVDTLDLPSAWQNHRLWGKTLRRYHRSSFTTTN